MKKMNIVYCLLFLSAICVCVYIFGFSKETKESMKNTIESAKGDAEENFQSVRDDVKETFGLANDEFVIKIKNQLQPTEKEKFVIEMKKQLDFIDLKLKKQEDKMKDFNESMKISTKKQWQNLKENRDKALEKLKEINEATEEKWENLKSGVKNAFAKLE